MSKPPLLVILGPTASGKSALAVEIAQQFNGEIISADSRQVYKGLDLGTGKITPEEMQGIPHHLLDVADPQEVFTVAQFKQQAIQVIDNIIARGKLPILCGGTGFYIQAVVDGIILPEVGPDLELRKSLEEKDENQLFTELKSADPLRAANIDPHNKRRLIRALEIVKTLGKVPRMTTLLSSSASLPNDSYDKSLPNNVPYNILQIGIETSDNVLKEKIKSRIITRINDGMIEEVARLYKNGLSWKRMDELGLEYRCISQHLRGELTKDGLINVLSLKIWQYVKRQRTWFKRDKRIHWLELEKDIKAVTNLIDEFLQKQPQKR